ncbi:F-box protein At4g00755-like isoform X2 [Juglans regia]|uniref:F-box protein At4g00755-like isoform X2 n=1 Tax=Juglans regia TaxID=51240 RepID=A0A6P9DV28_JUGRE|nr:F-box protein At4g00755-like isoform X2 [Juglans regia]
MEACMGFLDRLDPDILLKIFTYVDDPYDLVRVSSVSRSWRHFDTSYWSSKGQSNPAVPETLVYKLADDFCVITEINLRPFQVYFHEGLPIYSAKSVRFRMGHPKSPTDSGNDLLGYSLPDSVDDKFIWTYTSQEFPMAQESHLQKFRLPEPVLCVGGILQIELLGRVQRCEIDGLYYICISFVQVLGRPLSPALGVEILEPCGKFVLKIKNERPFELQAQSNHTVTGSVAEAS